MLYFPILNAEAATLEGNGSTDEELRSVVNGVVDLATDLFAEIDGVSLTNLDAYRVDSPLYTYGPLPENNLLQLFGYDAPAGITSSSVAAGIHLMLTPLPPGEHTIHFGGAFVANGTPLLSLDITYHLTVGH